MINDEKTLEIEIPGLKKNSEPQPVFIPIASNDEVVESTWLIRLIAVFAILALSLLIL